MRSIQTLAIITLSIAALATALLPDVCCGDAGDALDTGNTSWLLVCSALVFIMSPGVALFYGGMIRKQSMSSTMAQTAIVMGIMAVSWTVIGYTLAFSGDYGGVIGNLDRALLSGLDSYDSPESMKELGFALFQMTFALITAAIVIGACMERVRFNAMAVFIAIWSMPPKGLGWLLSSMS